MKKGILELIVLLCVKKKDRYGYELIEEVSKIVDVNDGTVYPILKRLTNERYFDTYLVESTEGPPRKYYKMTTLGLEQLEEQLKIWKEFSTSVCQFIKECENDE
jgi:PadR family transcriptional regulator PadR